MKILETPRDGIQGIKQYIPVAQKIDYINSLLKVGFDIVDVGSFVSRKAIPQLWDTAEVIRNLDLTETKSKIMVLVANKRGGEIAVEFDEVDYLSFPFSISQTFLKRNINSDIERSLIIVDDLVEICQKTNKQLAIYISMGFGNPYGDEWNMEIVEKYVEILLDKGIRKIPFADVLGNSTISNIEKVFSTLIPKYPEVEFSFHLHTKARDWYPKVNAAYKAGCRSFEGVINGLGGCPAADDELLGNLSTRRLLEYCLMKGIKVNVDWKALEVAEKKFLQMTDPSTSSGSKIGS